MTDLAFRDSDIIQFICVIQILHRRCQVFFRQQKIEEVSDCRDGYPLYAFNISGFCFLVTNRFDPAVPFLVVHAEDRLRQGQTDRDTHIFIEGTMPQLAGEIKRRVQ